jgi:flagellar assembly factor FliW
MPSCQTRYFGLLEYSSDDLIALDGGLLGFENATSFLLMQMADQFPLVYLQSVTEPDLCFLALPVLSVRPDYRLALAPDDAARASTPNTPVIGSDVLCLVLVTLRPEGATANLLAPLVINLQTRNGCQCINAEPGYSHQHAIEAPAEQGAAA